MSIAAATQLVGELGGQRDARLSAGCARWDHSRVGAEAPRQLMAD